MTPETCTSDERPNIGNDTTDVRPNIDNDTTNVNDSRIHLETCWHSLAGSRREPRVDPNFRRPGPVLSSWPAVAALNLVRPGPVLRPHLLPNRSRPGPVLRRVSCRSGFCLKTGPLQSIIADCVHWTAPLSMKTEESATRHR